MVNQNRYLACNMHRFEMFIGEFCVFLVILHILDVKGNMTLRRSENDDPNENTIETNPDERYSLEMVRNEISDLKELIQQQTTYLQILMIRHEKLESEHTNWLKRYKSTRRYLRKMNRSQQCRDPKNTFEGNKLHNEGDKPPMTDVKERREFDVVERENHTEVVALKNAGKKEQMVVSGDNPGFYDFEVDLTSGAFIGSQTGISWVSKITKGIEEKCGLQGVVKLKFPALSDGIQETIMIDMWIDTPSEWVFNIGDSAANDGLSGDGNYQENDSEAEGYNHTFTVYGSDKSQSFDKVLYTANYAIRTNMTVLITNEAISWKSLEIGDSIHFKTINDTSLFALNGQSDSQGAVNYDIYFSMNRAIAGNYRSGSGLCKVAFKWLQAL